MIKKIYEKVGDNLIITIPLKTNRANPYDDEYRPEMDNVIGLYEGPYENGLCYRIDMDYKGKPDQWTDYFFKLDGSKEEFDEMCKYLGVDSVITSRE
ncbi:MAG: hypothetical protein WC069_05875 [Candidatus Shapirobacteria bacterium]